MYSTLEEKISMCSIILGGRYENGAYVLHIEAQLRTFSLFR